MIAPTLTVMALVAMTASGLVKVADVDVEQRHGQAIADAVALAAIRSNGAATDLARRNDANLLSMSWDVDNGARRITVVVRGPSGALFRSAATNE